MNIKKIIAREGLIIVAIGIVGLVTIIFVPSLISPKPIEIKRDYYAEEIEHKPSPQYKRITTTEELNNIDIKQERVRTAGLFLLILGYPVYWLIRFTIWAIATLRK